MVMCPHNWAEVKHFKRSCVTLLNVSFFSSPLLEVSMIYMFNSFRAN